MLVALNEVIKKGTYMKFGIKIFVLAAFVGAMQPASASPVYYSFQGTVNTSNFADHAVGKAVNYTVMVDQATDGYYHDAGVTVYTYNDYNNGFGYTVDFFLAEYVSGDALSNNEVGSPYLYDYHLGYNQNSIGTINGVVIGSNPNNTYNNNYASTYVYSDLTLIGISQDAPGALPEPSTWALFDFGLIGMGVLTRKHRLA